MDTGTGQQEAGLGEAAAGFVHGNRRHIGPGGHSRYRQIIAKVEMGAVGFVGQAEHSVAVGQVHNGPEIGADAVVGGVVYQDGHGAGVLGNGLFYIFPPHAQGDAKAAVDLRIDVDRDSAAEDEGVDNAAVNVPGQDYFIASLAGGENHGLNGAGGAAYHQKGIGCSKGLGRQLFCLPDNGNRMTEVVQGLHAVHVNADTALPQKVPELRVAPAPLVTGNIEGNNPHLAEPFQRLENRGALLFRHSGQNISVDHFINPAK